MAQPSSRYVPDRPREPHQVLAVAVLQLALDDARNPRLPSAARRAAKAWITSERACGFWAEVAGLDGAAVASQARRLLKAG